MTMPAAQADGDFARLIDKIARERGFGCASYKEKCVRRRIAARMRARAVHTYDQYARLLDQDAAEWELLLDALTINVTRLFRNPETFDAIYRLVIPQLWGRPSIRIWSAGCASGEEPYTLAILLHRYATEHDALHLLHRVSILGTDIDRGSLKAAEEGAFAEYSLVDTPADIRRLYFPGKPPCTVPPDVGALVRFERHDLLQQEPPPGPWHLIICRNVIIYFDRPSQEMLFDRFHSSLVPDGFLVLGKVETLLGWTRPRFQPVEGRERIFRRA